MKTLIRNGHIVTAVDSYVADIFIDGSTVTLIGKDLSGIVGGLTEPSMLQASSSSLVESILTRIWSLPFGGTSASDDFETGTRAAAFGGTTTIIDFAVQYRGQSLNQALDTWFAEGGREGVRSIMAFT